MLARIWIWILRDYAMCLSVRASLTLPKELNVFLYTVSNVSPTSRASRTLRGMMESLVGTRKCGW